jgi:hypothetical protein
MPADISNKLIIAQSMGLNIIGTLGLFIEAYKQGLIGDIDGLLTTLKTTAFRLPANVNKLRRRSTTKSKKFFIVSEGFNTQEPTCVGEL